MAVLPLFEGGGSRIKVLEALAAGCPVIATDKAVEGLDLEAGRHFLRAETAGAFAAAVETMCGDTELRTALAGDGADHVRRHHAPERLARAAAEAIASLRKKK